MTLPTLLDTASRLTDAILMGKPGTIVTLASLGGVPTTRIINTTSPLAGGGNLSADLTLTVAVTPANPGGAVALQPTTPGTQQSGDINIDGTLIAATGVTTPTLTGNTTGTHTGSVIGNVAGNVTGNVTGSVTQLKDATGIVDVSASAAPVTGQALVATDATHATWQSVAGIGTVTNVGTSGPLTGGPITSTGTLGFAATPGNDGGAICNQPTYPTLSGHNQGYNLYTTRGVFSANVMVAPDPGSGGVDGTPNASITLSRGSGVLLQDYNGSGSLLGNTIYTTYSRGTFAAPTVISNGDPILNIYGEGYNNNTSTMQKAAQLSFTTNASVGASGNLPGFFKLSVSDPTIGMVDMIQASSTGISLSGLVGMGSYGSTVQNFALANGANQNLNVAKGIGTIRITGPTGAFQIGGIANVSNGKYLHIWNSTAFQMTINNLDAGSTAQIVTPTGGNVNCKSAMLQYNNLDANWLLIWYV